MLGSKWFLLLCFFLIDLNKLVAVKRFIFIKNEREEECYRMIPIIETSFNIYYQNSRKLRSKSSDLYCAVLSEEYAVLSLIETWLNIDISNGALFYHRYTAHRKDRNGSTSCPGRGGGMLVTVYRRFRSERFPDVLPSVE